MINASFSQITALATNRVLCNTYSQLSMTLLFSALTAPISLTLNLPQPGIILTLIGYFGLLFLTIKFRNQPLGLAFVFALTGFMGYTLEPIIYTYLSLENGPGRISGYPANPPTDPDVKISLIRFLGDQ
jgi:modulator of FtsH protease